MWIFFDGGLWRRKVFFLLNKDINIKEMVNRIQEQMARGSWLFR